jgi:lipid-A-disaccharide synthase-like uncharacterized protein
MPAFLNFLPNMSLLDTVLNIVALLGAVLLAYGVFLEAERRQDAVFIIASACLLVYSLWIGNKIFSLAMAGLLIGSAIELVEIIRGKHKHVCVPEYHKKSK